MHMRADRGTGPGDLASWSDLEVAAEIFRLLADPTRVGLVHALSHEDELSVSALAQLVGKRQPAVSQHLARLRMARLMTTRRQGTTVLYRLANEHVGQLVTDALHQAEHLGSGVPAHHL